MSWKIVEFGELSTSGANSGDGVMGVRPMCVSIVPKTWLYEREGGSYCWWPSKSCVNVTNLVKTMAPPESDWDTWHVIHVYEETLYDYALARDVLKNGSEVTDLEEHIRALKEKEYGRGKRSPKRKYVRDGNDIDGKARGLRSVLTAPPISSSDEDEFDEVHGCLASGGLQKRSSINASRLKGGSLKSSVSRSLYRGSASSGLQEKRPKGAVSQQPSSSSTSPMTQCDAVKVMAKLESMAKMMERMDGNISRLSTKVMALEETQQVILGRLNEGFHNIKINQEQPASSSLSLELPITSWPHYCKIMEKVRDGEVKEKLVNVLSRVGGKDLTAVANSILSKLMTNSFASQCSWKGQQGNKKSLHGTPLLNIVNSAVVRHLGMEGTTEDKVKDRIQNWLKQANRRQIQVQAEMEEETVEVCFNDDDDDMN